MQRNSGQPGPATKASGDTSAEACGGNLNASSDQPGPATKIIQESSNRDAARNEELSNKNV